MTPPELSTSPSVTRLADPVPRVIAADAPFIIVMNAGSGRKQSDEIRVALEETLGAAGRQFDVRLVERPSQFADITRQAVHDAKAQNGVVVGAGGDGTLCAVAQAVLGSGCAFAVLPRGTFNYFSRDHGIPADPAKSIALLLNARAFPVQVGFVNERMFLVNASLGLYPKLLEDRERYKRQFGRSRLIALWSAAVTLLRAHRHLHLHIEHDGTMHEVRTSTLFVGNNRLQLEQIGMAQAPQLERGLLAAIAPRAIGRLAQFGLTLRGAARRMSDADNGISFAFKRITVTHPSKRHRHVKVATDGEINWITMPLEFRVASEPLFLLKPEADVANANRS
ncbi:diacylglycerol/lipid kinase family protein [Caballeronia sordidicola]|uniref:diacylglycerol/lipid kinase family protein n=1 Tax=Caballeronia sordidicola TaxID=196367 RepID=UPI0004CFEFDE|nr:diacylglycerol kinase family protein [Caballeronia sordidicola]